MLSFCSLTEHCLLSPLDAQVLPADALPPGAKPQRWQKHCLEALCQCSLREQGCSHTAPPGLLQTAPPCLLPSCLPASCLPALARTGGAAPSSSPAHTLRQFPEMTLPSTQLFVPSLSPCSYSAVWLHVPLRSGTGKDQCPCTKRNRNLLTTSATAQSVPGNQSRHCACTSKTQLGL